MAEKINGTADWAPGTLDKTRKNIGDISDKDAADMAKKLGGQVLYERTSSGGGSGTNKAGRIVRQTSGGSSGSSGSGSSSGSSSSTGFSTSSGRRKKEELPVISKKAASTMDKLMMSAEYKIKPNYGMFNFIRSFQKNGMEKIVPEFYEYTIKQATEHMEGFITVIKTLIQIAPSTYKS